MNVATKVKAVFGAIALSLVVFACSSNSSIDYANSAIAPTEEVQDLLRRFKGSCEQDDYEWSHSRAVFRSVFDVEEWVTIAAIDFKREPESVGGLEMVVAGISGTGTDDEHSGTELLFTPELLEAVEWGLAEGSGAAIAVKALSGLELDGASAAIVTTADGHPFFPADCKGNAVDQPLREELGEDFDRIVSLIPTTPREGIDALFVPESN